MGKKKEYTLEDWQAKADILGELAILSFSKNRAKRTMVLVKCKACGQTYERSAAKLDTAGCSKCKNLYRPTTAEALAVLKDKHPTLDFTDFSYKTNKDKIKYKCKECNYEGSVAYNDFVRSYSGCPYCSGLRLTNETALVKVTNNNPHIIITPFEYKINDTMVLCEFVECGHKHYLSFNKLAYSKGVCPDCAKNYSPSSEEALERVQRKHPKLEFRIFTYKNTRSLVPYICKQCGLNHLTPYASLMQGHGCPKCADNYSPTTEEARKNLEDKRPDLIFLDFKYNKQMTLIPYICKTCGLNHKASYMHLMAGVGCPDCASSRLERDTNILLNKLSIEFVSQYKFKECKNIYPLIFDFYIQDLNLLIECNGAQHYRVVEYFGGVNEFEYRKKNDAIKFNFCKDNDINLLYVVDRRQKAYKDVYQNTIFFTELEDYIKKLIEEKLTV